MSVVVAVECPEGVAMAWDSGIFSDDSYDLCDSKAWLARRWLGVGLAGDCAPERIIRYKWNPPAARPLGTMHHYLNTTVIDEWQNLLSEIKEINLQAIIAWGGLAWVVQDAQEAARSARGYAAIGAGAAWAEGALAALIREGLTASEAINQARRAVEIAEKHCTWVRGATHTLWIPSV